MGRSARIPIAVFVFLARTVFADELLDRYEGDLLPYDPAVGWLIANPCDEGCHESLEDGALTLRWDDGTGDFAGYGVFVTENPEPAPPTLWVEWHFRSNHPQGPLFSGCDGIVFVLYKRMFDAINMTGDGAISFSGSGSIRDLELEKFHLLRFESLDGSNYRFSADGRVFYVNFDNSPSAATVIQFGGRGGCAGDLVPGKFAQWDFVRIGTVSFGEPIVAADPPQGPLSLQVHGLIDRFTVTFDAPNYVYVEDIGVESTSGTTPAVLWTRRPRNGPPDTVEIVLDRPLPLDGVTTFTFDDGVVTSTVQYEYLLDPIDTDGDGIPNDEDADPLDPRVCRDEDGDSCDDCAVGVDGFGPLADFDPANDGPDTDADGLCDVGDPDLDNDGVANEADADPLDPQVCGDVDADGCDDCAVGVDGFGPQVDFDPADDGPDADADGICDVTDNCIDAPNPAQVDSDGDGFGAACEECDTDANKTRPGICGCGTPDQGDSDGDTVLDCVDLCEGLDDRIDTDDNGVPDCAEHIPTVSTWGLVVLALLLLTAGKVFFSRRAISES